MGLFGSKKPIDACPVCGQRLFMENADGTRTCVKCGHKIGQKTGGLYRASVEEEANKGSTPAKSATCPSCGSNAELVSFEEDGTEVYRCPVCDHRFEKAPKVRQAPAPVKKEPEALGGKAIFDIAVCNTVEVHAYYGKGGGAGSGFFFDNGLLLTNAHVVSDHDNGWKPAEKVTINFKNGKKHEATVLYRDVEQDMALLKTKLVCEKVVKIASEGPNTGETIFAVGNTKGQGMCILEGIVADASRQIRGLPFMMISANTFGGNSGGPIFNDKGEVVGILTLGDIEVVSMNYAITVPRIHAFLEKAIVEAKKKRAI